MLGFLARMFRVLWRPENEGSQGGAGRFSGTESQRAAAARTIDGSPSSGEAVVLAFPTLMDRATAAPLPAKPRYLAARLHGVQKLNQPVSRARAKSVTSPAGKPKPLVAEPAPKPLRAVAPGVVLNRVMPKPPHRASADIIDFSEARRARLVMELDLEIAHVFS